MPFKLCLLLLFLTLFHLVTPASQLPQNKMDTLTFFNGTAINGSALRPAVGNDPDLAHRVKLLQEKIKALEALGFNMNSVIKGSEVIDEEKYQALKVILADCESLLATVENGLDTPAYGNTTKPLPGGGASKTTQAPRWSYIYVDAASVGACIMSSLAPVVHLVKGWRAYYRTNQIPDLKTSSWLIIDFIGKSFILSFLLVQKLIQHVEITAYNFITPGATLIIETFVIANTVFFRYRTAQVGGVPLLDDI